MARRAMITPLTLYNLNPNLFDGLQLPDYHFPRAIEYDDLFLKDGWTLDKQTLIDNLLLETAELDVIYTDPDLLEFAIGAWCRKEFHIWQALYETLFYKYNPIWNKDGTVKEMSQEVRDLLSGGSRSRSRINTDTDNGSENILDTDNTTENSSTAGSDINTVTEQRNQTIDDTDNTTTSGSSTDVRNNVRSNNKTEDVDTTTTNKVSAFDAMATFSNRDQAITDGTTDTTENGVEVENASNSQEGSTDRTYARDQIDNDSKVDILTRSSEADGSTDRTYNRERSDMRAHIGNETETESNNNSDSGTIDHNGDRREYGNIGIVTTQAMIQAERDLVKFNLYDLIIDSFKARFCVLVY